MLLDWRGEIVVVIASGPSARDADLDLVRGKAKTIVVNNSWRLAPWADVLFACDRKWWEEHRCVPEFKGVKLAGTTAVEGVKRVRISGRNSGLQAINVAVQFGARRIILVGFDMNPDLPVHWHPPHPDRLGNPNAERMQIWRREMERCAPEFMQRGVDVVNSCETSMLAGYRFVPLGIAVNGG